MTIAELLQEVDRFHDAKTNPAKTVDNVKFGDVSKEVTKVGVTMFATTDIIRHAQAAGMELIITHEPTFYADAETVDENDPVMAEKIKLIKESGIVLYRYHDHPHGMEEDMIDAGTIYASGLKGKITGKPYWAITGFELDETVEELVSLVCALLSSSEDSTLEFCVEVCVEFSVEPSPLGWSNETSLSPVSDETLSLTLSD